MRYQPRMLERSTNSFRSGCVAVVLVLCFFGCRADRRHPDVLLLIVDTLRADHLHHYGYPRNTSPALDAFANSSTVFRQVVAPASWTLPSTASLMTGTYPSLHGLRAQKGLASVTTLRAEVATLAEAFRAKGYQTAAVVTNPWVSSDEHGLRRGFTDFREVDKFSSDQINQVARELLAEQRPVFLYLHYMDVHGPYNQSGRERVEDMGPVRKSDWRPLGRKERKTLPGYLRIPGVRRLDGYVDAYDRGIRAWDDDFGKLVGWLRRTDRLDHTVVSVLADHGEEFLDHGGWDHGTTLYQEQIAVPWILYAPNKRSHHVRDDVVSLIDVAPTLLGAAGVPVPTTMMGRDLGVERGNTLVSVFSEHGTRSDSAGGAGATWVAARRGDMKWIVGPEGGRCYDLRSDPREQAPTASSRCEPQLPRDLEHWRRETAKKVAMMAAQPTSTLSPSDRERLRELGYGE